MPKSLDKYLGTVHLLVKLVQYILLEGLKALCLGGSSPGAWVEGRETEITGSPSTQNSSLKPKGH